MYGSNSPTYMKIHIFEIASSFALSRRTFANLRADLVNLAKTYSTFYTELPTKGEKGYPHLTTWSEWVQHSLMQTTIEDISPALASLRQIKSAGEIALIQKAVDASVDAHIAAMKMMRPGLFEYQIAARMKEVHEMEGCSREAYAPIVGTGLYSTVLHYDALKNEIKDGDVVVIDVACEYGGYAADITRTLPANGKFTARASAKSTKSFWARRMRRWPRSNLEP